MKNFYLFKMIKQCINTTKNKNCCSWYGYCQCSVFNTKIPHLEPLGHVCRADFVVLVGHVTTFQLTGLVDLKNALPPLPPLCLLLRSVPALFILVFLLLLALIVNIGFKVGKVKVSTKDFLGFLEGSVKGGIFKRRR